MSNFHRDSAAHDPQNSHVLEKGHVYFLYRPKVGLDGDVKNLVDVQHLIMVLYPFQKSLKKRMIIVPKKKLPKIDSHQKFMAVVNEVSKDIGTISDSLKPHSYKTKTRGTHTIPPARLIGRGSYLISYHQKDETTRLLYVLDHPAEISSVQKAFNIELFGHFIITLKNQEYSELPGDILAKYHGKSFIPIQDRSFLDIEGAQIVIIGGSREILKEEGGGEIMERSSTESHENVDKLFKELHLSKSENPSDPTIAGTFV